MSTLKVNTIQHSNGTNAMTIDSSGNAAFSGVVTGTPLGNRNLIINGDMRIAQRGTSVTGINNDSYNTIDRWVYNSIGSTASVWTQSQSTDVPTGQGFGYSLKMQCTTSAPSDTYGASLEQRIESQMLQHLKFGTSSAESFTISFWVKSNKTGTFICEINQKDIDTVISRTYTINTADTWEKKTVTFVGDTSNAMDNDNTEGFRVAWWLYAGSIYNSGTLNTTWSDRVTNAANRAVGQVNLADSTSNYINITGVQLEVGEVATEFEHRPYDMELQRCQRYFFQPPSAYTDVTGFNYNSGVYSAVFFPTTMRATPFVTNLGGTTWYQGGSAYTFTYINASSTTAFTRLHGSVSGGLNGGAGTFYPYFKADAEL